MVLEFCGTNLWIYILFLDEMLKFARNSNKIHFIEIPHPSLLMFAFSRVIKELGT